MRKRMPFQEIATRVITVMTCLLPVKSIGTCPELKDGCKRNEDCGECCICTSGYCSPNPSKQLPPNTPSTGKECCGGVVVPQGSMCCNGKIYSPKVQRCCEYEVLLKTDGCCTPCKTWKGNLNYTVWGLLAYVGIAHGTVKCECTDDEAFVIGNIGLMCVPKLSIMDSGNFNTILAPAKSKKELVNAQSNLKLWFEVSVNFGPVNVVEFKPSIDLSGPQPDGGAGGFSNPNIDVEGVDYSKNFKDYIDSVAKENIDFFPEICVCTGGFTVTTAY